VFSFLSVVAFWRTVRRTGLPRLGQYVAIMAFATLPKGFLAAADIIHH
jgi:hypothetical protein